MKKSPKTLERERCVKAVEAHMPYAESLDAHLRESPLGESEFFLGAASMLLRIRNIIANGLEPVEFGEQMQRDYGE